MASLCQEIGIYLPENLLLISLLSKEVKTPFFNEYLASLPVWAAEQELASSSFPLVAELLKCSMEETIDKIVSLLINKNRSVFVPLGSYPNLFQRPCSQCPPLLASPLGQPAYWPRSSFSHPD